MVPKVVIRSLLLAAFLWPIPLAYADHQRTVPPGLDRQKRTLVFTEDSATGILIALSVPLLITGRNIFMAYNFEANYGMPGDATDFTQGVLKKVDNDQIEQPAGDGTDAEVGRAVRATGSSPARFTRKKLYRTIELNLVRYGYDGKKCILRMICELVHHPVDELNGVLGDVLQLMFTPSDARYERLPHEFYRAKELGERRNCSKYSEHCPKDPLDMISLML